jgi:hypothetical protein
MINKINKERLSPHDQATRTSDNEARRPHPQPPKKTKTKQKQDRAQGRILAG